MQITGDLQKCMKTVMIDDPSRDDLGIKEWTGQVNQGHDPLLNGHLLLNQVTLSKYPFLIRPKT